MLFKKDFFLSFNKLEIRFVKRDVHCKRSVIKEVEKKCVMGFVEDVS